MSQQKKAVESGLWATFRYNPELKAIGKNPMSLDYKGPKIPVKDYMYNEARFKMVEKMNSKDAQKFLDTASEYAKETYKRYKNLTQMSYEEDI